MYDIIEYKGRKLYFLMDENPTNRGYILNLYDLTDKDNPKIIITRELSAREFCVLASPVYMKKLRDEMLKTLNNE